MVRQLDYSAHFDYILSAAENWTMPNQKLPGLFFLDLGVSRHDIKFKMEMGCTCFFLDEQANILATGGPDWKLRLWSPVVPDSPFCILSGHNAGIMHIFMQDNGTKIYSVDKNKVSLFLKFSSFKALP